jgi:uncharacterized protein (DUF302 family)
MQYGMLATVPLSYDQAIGRVTDELKKEGFGILTTIDVKDTLKKKLDVDFKRYAILGACNPSFAHQSLQAEEEIGLLLPCNVVVYEKNGGTVVGIFDPRVMTTLTDNAQLRTIASDVRTKLERVLKALSS